MSRIRDPFNSMTDKTTFISLPFSITTCENSKHSPPFIAISRQLDKQTKNHMVNEPPRTRNKNGTGIFHDIQEMTLGTRSNKQLRSTSYIRIGSILVSVTKIASNNTNCERD